MSWVRNQRIATPRFPSSVRMRAAHSACRSAGQSAFSTSAAKYAAWRRCDLGRLVAGGQALGGHLPDRREHGNRGSTSLASTRTRLCPARASSRSSVRSSERSATRTAASTVQPSAKTDMVASICCSASSSSPRLHSTVARSVRCRSGRSTGPAPSASRRVPSRASSAFGSSNRVRAAASSMASGRPSRRRQISTTARALSSVSVKPWRTAWARSTNSCTAGSARSCSSGRVIRRRRHGQRGRPDTPARPAAAAPCGWWRGS